MPKLLNRYREWKAIRSIRRNLEAKVRLARHLKAIEDDYIRTRINRYCTVQERELFTEDARARFALAFDHPLDASSSVS